MLLAPKPAQVKSDHVGPGEGPWIVEGVADELRVHVLWHLLTTSPKPRRSWFYITEGIAAQGQAEMAFCLEALPNESPGRFPQDPVALFGDIYAMACQGRTVQAGDRTVFGKQNILVGRACAGLLYAPMPPVRGLKFPPACLAVLPVLFTEMEALEQCGPLRLLGQYLTAAGCAPQTMSPVLRSVFLLPCGAFFPHMPPKTLQNVPTCPQSPRTATGGVTALVVARPRVRGEGVESFCCHVGRFFPHMPPKTQQNVPTCPQSPRTATGVTPWWLAPESVARVMDWLEQLALERDLQQAEALLQFQTDGRAAARRAR